MAKEGTLPDAYEYHVFNSFEGLIISSALVTPLIIFFNISEITTVAAIVMLLVQGTTHIAHLRLIKHTGAKLWVIVAAIVAMFSVAALTLYSTYKTMPEIAYYLIATFFLAFIIEVMLCYFNKKKILKQSVKSTLHG